MGQGGFGIGNNIGQAVTGAIGSAVSQAGQVAQGGFSIGSQGGILGGSGNSMTLNMKKLLFHIFQKLSYDFQIK